MKQFVRQLGVDTRGKGLYEITRPVLEWTAGLEIETVDRIANGPAIDQQAPLVGFRALNPGWRYRCLGDGAHRSGFREHFQQTIPVAPRVLGRLLFAGERIVSLDAQVIFVSRLVVEPFYLVVEEPTVHYQAHAPERSVTLPARRSDGYFQPGG